VKPTVPHGAERTVAEHPMVAAERTVAEHLMRRVERTGGAHGVADTLVASTVTSSREIRRQINARARGLTAPPLCICQIVLRVIWSRSRHSRGYREGAAGLAKRGLAKQLRGVKAKRRSTQR